MLTMHWLVLTLLILLVVVPSSGVAETVLPAGSVHEEAAELDSPAHYALLAVPPVMPADAPSAHKVVDKKFIAVMASLGGAETCV